MLMKINCSAIELATHSGSLNLPRQTCASTKNAGKTTATTLDDRDRVGADLGGPVVQGPVEIADQGLGVEDLAGRGPVGAVLAVPVLVELDRTLHRQVALGPRLRRGLNQVLRRDARERGLAGLDAARALGIQVVFASAGDDCSMPERVSRCMRAIAERPRTILVQSWLEEVDASRRHLKINTLDTGLTLGDRATYGLSQRCAGRTWAPHGAAMAYSRRLIEAFGPLPEEVIFEDNVVNVRAELLGEVLLLAEPLVQHRNHGNQISRLEGDWEVCSRRLAARLRSDTASRLRVW